MKGHWKTAPEHVQKSIREARAVTWLGAPSPAADYVVRLFIAYRGGFAFDPPSTPQLAESERLKASGDESEWALHKNDYRFELEAERTAVSRWGSLSVWRQGPSNEEIAAKTKADREAAELEQEVEARASAILAKQRAEAIEQARAQARREVVK